MRLGQDSPNLKIKGTILVHLYMYVCVYVFFHGGKKYYASNFKMVPVSQSFLVSKILQFQISFEDYFLLLTSVFNSDKNVNLKKSTKTCETIV